MVADNTKQTMQMFDVMADGFRTLADAQMSFFKTMGGAFQSKPGCEPFAVCGDTFTRTWFPFVGKEVENAVETFNTGFNAGVKAFKTACDVAANPADGGDVYKTTKSVMDSTLETFNANLEVFGKAGKRSADDWASMCEKVCCEESSSKQTAKPTGK